MFVKSTILVAALSLSAGIDAFSQNTSKATTATESNGRRAFLDSGIAALSFLATAQSADGKLKIAAKDGIKAVLASRLTLVLPTPPGLCNYLNE